MKKFIIGLGIVLFFTTNTRADFEVEIVPPVEIIKTVGKFVSNTGKKACEGLTTTVFGIGEIITAPFRVDVYRPKKKTYHFIKPKLIIEYQRGEFYKGSRHGRQ